MVRIVNHEYGQTKSLAVQVETICFVSSGRTGTKQMFDPRVAETKITKRDLASGDRRPVWSVATTAVRICYRFTTSLSVFVLFFFSFGNSARRSLVLSGRRALCVISGTDFCRLASQTKDGPQPQPQLPANVLARRGETIAKTRCHAGPAWVVREKQPIRSSSGNLAALLGRHGPVTTRLRHRWENEPIRPRNARMEPE